MARRVLSPADLEGSQVIGAAPAPPRRVLSPADLEGSTVIKETTANEAALRGGMGGFFPFLDEVTGAVRALGETKDIRQLPDAYRRFRDAERARSDLTQSEHPGVFRGSQVVGALASAAVPGLNAAKGASLAAKGARAALVGGGYGLGESRADLTKGDVRGAAEDTLKGAAVSGGGTVALAGAGRALGRLGAGAAKRVAERPATDLLEKTPVTTVQDRALYKLGGRAGLAGEIRADKVLEAAARQGPDSLAIVARRQVDEIGEEIGKVYKTTDAMSPGIPIARVLEPLKRLLQEATDTLDRPRVAQLSAEIKGLERLTGKRELITASQVHTLAKRYGKGGFEGRNFANPSDAKQLGRDMYSGVRDVLQAHVDEVATANNNASTSASRLRFLNDRYSKLDALTDLAEAKAHRVSQRVQPSLADRARSVVGTLAGAGGIAASVVHGNLKPLILPAAVVAAPYAMRAADVGIATMYRALQAGGSFAEAMKIAVQYGVPRATAERVVEIWGSKD